MAAVNVWARDVVLVIALAAVLEMALPQGDFRRFARLVMGLLVLVAMIKPLMGYLEVAIALPGGALRPTRGAGTGSGYVFSGDSSLFPTANTVYTAQLRDHLVRLVSAGLGLEHTAVSVEVDLESGSGWPAAPRRIRVQVHRVPDRLVSAWIEQSAAAGAGGAAGGTGGGPAAGAPSDRGAALAAIANAVRVQLAGLYRLDPAAVEVSMPR